MFKSAAFDGIPSEAAEILTDVCPGNLKLLTVSSHEHEGSAEHGEGGNLYVLGTSEESACVAARRRNRDAVKNKTGLSETSHYVPSKHTFCLV